MKLGTKFLVTLSATALALVGWAVPAAVATGGGGSTDNKNTADYWLNQYDNAVACYYSEGDSGHGEVTNDAEGNEGVKLKEFVQSWEGDRWEVLIVKGGNDRNVYELPNANEVYHAPDNASGKPAGVSHWIVCKGSQEQQTFQPDCASMTFEYAGSSKDQHINVEIKPLGVNAGEPNVTLNFHNDDDSWSNPYTAVYADHPNWPGWAEYAVVWVQVSGQNYHWSGELKCGEPDPEYFICEWNAQNDEAVKTKVESIGNDDIEWVDGSECTPGEATYCFADGNGGFTEATVRDDGDFPLGEPVDAENCVIDEVEYEICVWDSENDTATKSTVPAITGDDILWVDGSECTPGEATYCFADGNGGFTEATVRDDGDFPLGEPVDAENCVIDEVEYVICTEGDDGWYGMTVTEDELPAEYTLWTGDAADCFEEYTTFFCWEIQGENLQTDQWGHPLFNGDLFDPPQEFVMEGDSFTDLRDCWDIVADCDTITWFQLDEYIVKSEEDEALLERLKEEGLGWNGESAYDAYMVVNWEFQSAVGEPCEEPTPEYICEWDAQNDVSVKTEVDEIGEGDIEWVEGIDCGPGENTYCFSDGDGGFMEQTVRDDGVFPYGDPVDAENCLLDEVEYFICEWDAQDSVAVKVEVDEIGEGDILWIDGSECTPDQVVICAQDGDTWYGLTVYEDQLPAEYTVWTGDAADCYDEPEYICVWDDENDTPVKTEVDSVSPMQTPWFDGSECTPGEATYCFADGDGGFVSATVRDDGVYPLGEPVPADECVESVNEVTICAQDGDTWYGLTIPEDELPAEYTLWTGDAADCFEEEEEIEYVEICVEGDQEGTFEAGTIPESDLTEDMILWDAEMEDGGCSDDFTVVLGAPPVEAPAATPIVAVATYAG